MQTYCLGCKNYTNNIGSKEVMMTNKTVIEKSRCVNCLCDKSRFLKQKSNNKTSWNNVDPEIFIY